MIRPGDPRIKSHMKKVSELQRKHPNVNWKTGLSKDQVAEIEAARNQI